MNEGSPIFISYCTFTLSIMSLLNATGLLTSQQTQSHKHQFFMGRVVHYSLPSYVCRVESNSCTIVRHEYVVDDHP